MRRRIKSDSLWINVLGNRGGGGFGLLLFFTKYMREGLRNIALRHQKLK